MIIRVLMLLLALCFMWFGRLAYAQFKKAQEGDLRGVLAGGIITYWALAIFYFIKLIL
jgi:hypothetical protein